MKKIFLILGLANLSLCLYAQVPQPTDIDNWVPNVYLTTGTELCDATPWKLVFHDNFNGNSLDTTKWITHISWPGMMKNLPGIGVVRHDNDNWRDARIADNDQSKTIFRKENIFVSNGTVKLKIKHEPNTWKCDTCYESERYTTKYSGAALCTRYYYQDIDKSFNNGKFEFKAKFPNFYKSFSTVWTWMGYENDGVNELDMAECTGKDWNKNPFWDFWVFVNWKNYVGRIYYPTHAWGWWFKTPSSYEFPFHIQKNVVRMAHGPYYPNQTYQNFIWGDMFDFTQWNTYTIEWDSTRIATYLNHQLVESLPKYYYQIPFGLFNINIGVGCKPILVPGSYHVTKGFPYRHKSYSQLRFTAGVQQSIGEDNSNDIYDLGQTELDYVSIWQRHLSEGYPTEICTNEPSGLQITGPNTICGAQTFSVPSNFGGGVWSASNNAVTISTSANNTIATVTPNGSSNYYNTVLTYNYAPGGCPEQTTSKAIATNTYTPQVTVLRNIFLFREELVFKVHNPVPNAQYQWSVNYGLFSPYEYTYSAWGSTIKTPRFAHFFLPHYHYKWTLKVTQCGVTREYSNYRFIPIYTPLSFSKPEQFFNKDSNTLYLEAFYNEEDSVAYESSVQSWLNDKYFDDERDTVSINTAISDALIDCAFPYLYFTEKGDLNEFENISIDLKAEGTANQTIVYPNPSRTDVINLQLSDKFNINDIQQVKYDISTLDGKILKSGSVSDNLEIKTDGLASGIYMLKLSQGTKNEHIKIQKIDK